MDFQNYIAELQGDDAIGSEAIKSYGPMVCALNALIMGAANKKLNVNDEPSDYVRFLLESNR